MAAGPHSVAPSRPRTSRAWGSLPRPPPPSVVDPGGKPRESVVELSANSQMPDPPGPEWRRSKSPPRTLSPLAPGSGPSEALWGPRCSVGKEVERLRVVHRWDPLGRNLKMRYYIASFDVQVVQNFGMISRNKRKKEKGVILSLTKTEIRGGGRRGGGRGGGHKLNGRLRRRFFRDIAAARRGVQRVYRGRLEDLFQILQGFPFLISIKVPNGDGVPKKTKEIRHLYVAPRKKDLLVKRVRGGFISTYFSEQPVSLREGFERQTKTEGVCRLSAEYRLVPRRLLVTVASFHRPETECLLSVST